VSAQGPLRDREPAGFDLIETLRFEPAAGFIRLDRHLARLAASAAELCFEHERDRVTTALAKVAKGATTPLRIRLVLSPTGKASATAQPFEPLSAGKAWTLRLAHTTLRSNDSLLRHKTTRREAYVQARAEYPATEADEVLLANERGEVCEGTITTLFADFGNGTLATPKLDCGLLAGVLRGEMLDHGKAKETVLSLTDLRAAKALFVGNSLRGLIPAHLA
jgi:4-amino-4-deoxychorismate lyase